MGKNKNKKDDLDEVLKEETTIKNEKEVENEEVVKETSSEEENILELKEIKKELLVLKDKNQRLENEKSAYADKLLRLSAEYENYRKRTDKEKERIYTDACEDVLKNMLPVLDNLERAANVEGGSIEALKTGVDMTIKQFTEALEKLGIEEIETKDGFDPNMHQAVMHIQDENLGENIVTEVFQKGYKKGDKVIRFTMVKVAN